MRKSHHYFGFFIIFLKKSYLRVLINHSNKFSNRSFIGDYFILFCFTLFLLKITLSYKLYLQSRNACICRLKGDPDKWGLWLLWVEIFQSQPLHTIQNNWPCM
jgi:hypothetical protein